MCKKQIQRTVKRRHETSSKGGRTSRHHETSRRLDVQHRQDEAGASKGVLCVVGQGGTLVAKLKGWEVVQHLDVFVFFSWSVCLEERWSCPLVVFSLGFSMGVNAFLLLRPIGSTPDRARSTSK